MPKGFEPILPKRPVVPGASTMFRRLTQRMTAFANEVWRECAEYEPPAPATYRRTMTLARSWSRVVRVSAGALEGVIRSSGNVAPYNRWIRGSKTQLVWARTRGWRTVQQIVAQYWPAARADFARILRGR